MGGVITDLLLRMVILLSKLVLPHFVLRTCKSDIGKVVASMGRFLACLNLTRTKMKATAIITLCAPLTLGRARRIGSVLSTAEGFCGGSKVLFLTLALMLVKICPFFVSKRLRGDLIH